MAKEKEVVIGFGKLVHDKDILSLTHTCKAKVKALWYTTPYGGGGSSRYKEVKDNSEFIKISRQNLKNMLGKYGYVLTGINLRLIYKNLSIQDIQSSKKLKKYVTGLLNSFFQQKLSYEHVVSGNPIYFAVLVEVPLDYISCLEKNNLVRDISVNDYPLFKGFLKYIPYYLKPKNIPEKYLYPTLKNGGAKDIFDILKETAKKLENDKLFNKYKNSEEFKDYIIKSEKYYKNLINRIKKNNFPISTYFPNEGRLYYSGNTAVRSDGLIWYLPGDWSVDRAGYEHDLVARNDYFTSCSSWSDLPNWYDDCETSCVSETSGNYCAFSFGTYNATLIEAGWPYTGIWTMTRGSANYTDFRLNSQEVFHSPVCFKFLNRWVCILCPFDNPWCMGGTPFRDRNPDLYCQRNSIALKRCEFQNFYNYNSNWAGKYDCSDAPWCD